LLSDVFSCGQQMRKVTTATLRLLPRLTTSDCDILLVTSTRRVSLT